VATVSAACRSDRAERCERVNNGNDDDNSDSRSPGIIQDFDQRSPCASRFSTYRFRAGLQRQAQNCVLSTQGYNC
jgi:hypothetical protein